MHRQVISVGERLLGVNEKVVRRESEGKLSQPRTLIILRLVSCRSPRAVVHEIAAKNPCVINRVGH